MLRLINSSFFVCLVGCASTTPHPQTVAQHERNAQHYDNTADSIEEECWKARRNELTVNEPQPCWKAQDLRFLEANRNAAAEERAEAARMRTLEASR